MKIKIITLLTLSTAFLLFSFSVNAQSNSNLAQDGELCGVSNNYKNCAVGNCVNSGAVNPDGSPLFYCSSTSAGTGAPPSGVGSGSSNSGTPTGGTPGSVTGTPTGGTAGPKLKGTGIEIPTGTGLSDAPVATILRNLLTWFLGIVGVIALIGFIVSGIQYLTAAGDEDTMQRAKRNLMYSIIGVVVVLASFVIIQAIDFALRAQSF